MALIAEEVECLIIPATKMHLKFGLEIKWEN
jgi:hypothetical protein